LTDDTVGSQATVLLERLAQALRLRAVRTIHVDAETQFGASRATKPYPFAKALAVAVDRAAAA
jgi:hypothetical protein